MSCGCDSRSPAPVMRTKRAGFIASIVARAAVAHRLAQAADELVQRPPRAALVRRRGPRSPRGRASRRPRRRPGSSGPSRTPRAFIAPSEPMPRYSLKRSPWWKTTSPGASSVPASIEPSITVSAPAAIAFAMSPDEVMPPSAITGTPCRAATSAHVVDRGHLRHADAGDDARRADRAGPDADLHRVGARVDQRLGRLAGRDVAGDHLDVDRRPLIARTISMHAARVAVRRVDDEHVARRRRRAPRARSSASGPTPTAAPTRSRPCSSFVACGYSIRFWMSLTVISPRSRPSASTTGASRSCGGARSSSASCERRPDRRRDEVARGHQRRDRLRRRRSRSAGRGW